MKPGSTASARRQAAQAANSLLTWVLRVVGWVLMFLGLLLIFKPIAVFGDVVPIVGSLLGAGIGLFSFLLASGLALITVAIAWLVYRPLLGLTLLLLAGAAIYLLVRRSRQATPAPAPTTLPPLPPLPPN